MKVFERPGPVNTAEVIDVLENVSSGVKYIVVASITGDSAVKVALKVKDKKIICVTCPQDMYWELEGMDKDLSLKYQNSEWHGMNGLKRV